MREYHRSKIGWQIRSTLLYVRRLQEYRLIADDYPSNQLVIHSASSFALPSGVSSSQRKVTLSVSP